MFLHFYPFLVYLDFKARRKGNGIYEFASYRLLAFWHNDCNLLWAYLFIEFCTFKLQPGPGSSFSNDGLMLAKRLVVTEIHLIALLVS